MSVQHYVTGIGDDSFLSLAKIYNVRWEDIANLTFGTTRASYIYPWLRDNGGKKQASDPNVPTGYHWSFSKGMVVNIPTDKSVSPVLSSYTDAKPGGPKVTIIYADTGIVGETGNPTMKQETAPAVSQQQTQQQSSTQQSKLASIGGDNSFAWILIIGSLVGFWYIRKNGKKGKKSRRSRKRRW